MAASPADVLRLWFDRVWNDGDASAIDELMAPTAVPHGLPTDGTPGPAGFRPFFHAFRAAFPDIRIEITHAFSEGDLAVVRCRVTGTNLAALAGVSTAATNRAADFTGITIARVVDGKIQEAWNEFDFQRMYQQLQLQPPAVV
jgi:predicted ester cyclase